MTTLWDTTGSDVVKALSAERRNAGSISRSCRCTTAASTSLHARLSHSSDD